MILRPVGAQVPPPTQAQSTLQQAVQQDPTLAARIRARISQSGMTPEQIRARLRAAGYPEGLLDAYLGEPAVGGAAATPGPVELSAIAALGLPLAVPTLPVDTGMV